MALAIRESIQSDVLSRRGAAVPGGGPEEERLAAMLADARALLVLDQCDLLGGAAGPLARLCAALRAGAPRVRLIVTSRERLEVAGHHQCALAPLDVPPESADRLGADHLLNNGSVRLFVERARLVDRGYAPGDEEAAAIAELCRRLEGLPLAVELAGARAGVLTPSEIAARLDSVLRESAEDSRGPAGARPRHSTLDACIRWSFDLLTLEERHLLARLSVFRGGWTLGAAESICSVGEPEIRAQDVRLLLTRLINKSLITYDSQSGRYAMLDSVKGFAGGALAPAERSALRVRHFEYFSACALRAETQISGTEQVMGLRTVQAEMENLGGALDAHDIEALHPEQFLRLARALHRFWYIRAYFHEGRRRLQEALDRAPGAEPLLRTQVQNAIGIIAFGLEDHAAAEEAYRASLAILQPTGTKSQIASIWDNIALACSERGRVEEAEAANAAALELLREAGDEAAAVRCRLNLVYHHIRRGDYDRAERICLDSMESLRAAGDRKREAVALHNLGEIAYFRGRDAEARTHFLQSIRLKDDLGDRRGVSLTVYMYGLVLLRQGLLGHAAALLAKALEIRTELGITALPMPADAHEETLRQLVAGLGPERFALEWNRGRELEYEEVVQTISTSLDTP
jgi:predicted ATPase